MVTTQVVELYATHTIDAETFIWRDGMEDWLTPFEIPDIAAALEARGLEPRTNDPVDGATDSTAEARQSGSWREPGKWKDGDGQKKPDATFDEVTVAMTAPNARALLDAAISAEEANASKVAEAAVEAKPEAATQRRSSPDGHRDATSPPGRARVRLRRRSPFRLPFEEPAEADGGVISSTAAPASSRGQPAPRRPRARGRTRSVRGCGCGGRAGTSLEDAERAAGRPGTPPSRRRAKRELGALLARPARWQAEGESGAQAK